MKSKINILSTRKFHNKIKLEDIENDRMDLTIISPYFFMLNVFVLSTFLGIIL